MKKLGWQSQVLASFTGFACTAFWASFTPALAQVPVASRIAADAAPGWTAAQVGKLRHWVEAAPDDALPRPRSTELDAAIVGGDAASLDRAATDLALRLASMHLLGHATTAERAGWRIEDPDRAINLRTRLDAALASDDLDGYFAGLRPRHPDYAMLRRAYASETDAARRATLGRNMERWRWMPHAPDDGYILVNAAAFEAALWRNGQETRRWRVIVGKPSTPTPVFSATVSAVTLNPWWNVPASIVRESVGALVRRNPALARKRGYVWSGNSIRQRPGPGNSLGEMKLEMPNPYTVYMHDTPSKNLFARDVRAFSHGCIRVDDALGFAATLLEGVRTRAQIDAIVATRRTTAVPLPARLPVYITYFTAGTRADGTLAFYPDIYARDNRIGFELPAAAACTAN
ncbi:MAG: L,D-transpeptidase family protein [Novosphingobium sp.]